MKEAYNSAAALYAGGAGGLGFVLGIHPLVPFPPYFAGLAVIVMLVGAGLFVFVSLRQRRTLTGTLVLATVLGLGAFGLLFGTMRAFVALPAGGPLLEF